MTTTPASPAEESVPRVPRTQVPPPRQRIFLPQTMRERAAVSCWKVIRQLLFRWSPPPLYAWRRFLLRVFGARIGRGVRVAPSTRVDFPWNLNLHDGVIIAHKVVLNCMGAIEIGRATRISQYAHLCAGTHDYTRADMQIERSPIRIGERAWIATDAFVGPGVTIGDHTLLAARSSAVKDLPADHVCMGEPAKPIRRWESPDEDKMPLAANGDAADH